MQIEGFYGLLRAGRWCVLDHVSLSFFIFVLRSMHSVRCMFCKALDL